MTAPEKPRAPDVGDKTLTAMALMIPAWRDLIDFLLAATNSRDTEFAISTLAVLAASMRSMSMETTHILEKLGEMDPNKILKKRSLNEEEMKAVREILAKSAELARVIRSVTKDDSKLPEIAKIAMLGAQNKVDPDKN